MYNRSCNLRCGDIAYCQLAGHVETRRGQTARVEVFLKVRVICAINVLGVLILAEALYAVSLLTVVAFGFTKLPILLFYERVLRGKTLERYLWALLAFILIWFVGFFFAEVLQCISFSVNFRT